MTMPLGCTQAALVADSARRAAALEERALHAHTADTLQRGRRVIAKHLTRTCFVFVCPAVRYVGVRPVPRAWPAVTTWSAALVRGAWFRFGFSSVGFIHHRR
jgi:hypothetical protein